MQYQRNDERIPAIDTVSRDNTLKTSIVTECLYVYVNFNLKKKQKKTARDNDCIWQFNPTIYKKKTLHRWFHY